MQRPRCRDAGIELPERPGRKVAGVGVRREPGFHLLLVQRREIVVTHIHFAPHVDHARDRRSFQPFGNVPHGADVGGHILALEAVATRRRIGEHAILVAQRTREAVDLRFGDEGQRRICRGFQETAYARDEFRHIGWIERIAERQHRHRMFDLAEFWRGRRAHLLRQRVWGGELRIRGFERSVAPPQSIVIGIRDGRRVVLVIASIVGRDLRAKPRMFGARLISGRRCLLSGHPRLCRATPLQGQTRE